jgi:hypothetical protein
MRSLALVLLANAFLLCSQFSFAASPSVSNLNFDQAVANPFEARIGFIGQPSEKHLRMDIGGSFDLLHSNYDHSILSFGVDLMTYTRLRSEGHFKFPVETTDYFFGINSALRLKDSAKTALGKLFKGDEQIRIRIAHISSHLIDGFTDANWVFKKSPFVFSREFVDVMYRPGNLNNFAPYVGVNYIFSTQPRNVNRLEAQAGLDYIVPLGNSSDFDLVAGYNFALKGFDDIYSGVNSAQVGIKYNFSNNRAIFVGAYFYRGLSMHGMFFNQKDSYIGIGTQVYYF